MQDIYLSYPAFPIEEELSEVNIPKGKSPAIGLWTVWIWIEFIFSDHFVEQTARIAHGLNRQYKFIWNENYDMTQQTFTFIYKNKSKSTSHILFRIANESKRINRQTPPSFGRAQRSMGNHAVQVNSRYYFILQVTLKQHFDYNNKISAHNKTEMTSFMTSQQANLTSWMENPKMAVWNNYNATLEI